MSKNTISVLLSFYFLFSFNLAFADVIISEVKYSPTTKQWIEIYNDTDNDVDITTYKILDSGASVNGHSISLFGDGSSVIPKHSFGVVAKVPDDFGSVSFPLFKSALNIKVSEDNVILKNNSGESISSVSIDGSATDGRSWQFFDGSWVSEVPTPGASNEILETVESEVQNKDGVVDTSMLDSSGGSGKTGQEINSVVPNKTKIIVKTPVFAGVPVLFKVENTVSDRFCGKYFWNFGDGSSAEVQKVYSASQQKYAHTYEYEGEYVVTLECFKSYLSSEPFASDKIYLKVSRADISISKVGDDRDFFVEISNNTLFEADISGWMLSSAWKKFIFPRNSVLKSKNKITVSSKITNFSMGDRDTLKLINLQGETVFDYALLLDLSKVVSKNPVPAKTFSVVKSSSSVESAIVSDDINGSAESVPIGDLLAQSVGADVGAETKSGISYIMLWFLVLLLVGSGGAYLIRNYNKKRIMKGSTEDGFELVD